MEKEKIITKHDCKAAKETFYIKIVEDGPYFVYGNPPINQEIIVCNQDGDSWEYKKGMTFSSTDEPVALCRCGNSEHAPFCDGAHIGAEWNPQETASKKPILEEAEEIEGIAMVLADNRSYCAFARFCDAGGRIWDIVREEVATEERKELMRHEVGHCPAGRLLLLDKETGKLFEPEFEPSIGILEDQGLKVSGPIWVKGGIRIESADGTSYEIRNRVTLCRCGYSKNKPFCDGRHASKHFQDGLPIE